MTYSHFRSWPTTPFIENRKLVELLQANDPQSRTKRQLRDCIRNDQRPSPKHPLPKGYKFDNRIAARWLFHRFPEIALQIPGFPYSASFISSFNFEYLLAYDAPAYLDECQREHRELTTKVTKYGAELETLRVKLACWGRIGGAA